ncbi:hypothetical protein CsSME_00043525 [Camellia sinensis var. sinensis]
MNNPFESTDMWEYMETLLGDLAFSKYLTFKGKYKETIRQLKGLGDNPWSFTSFIKEMFIGYDPSRRNDYTCIALTELDQITLGSWKYVVPISKEYLAMAVRIGKSFDEEIGNKYFMKLPRELGREIENKWPIYYANLPARIASGEVNIRRALGVGPRIVFIFQRLREKCIEVKIQKDLKKQNYYFCSSIIYTPQQYEDKYNKKKYGIERKNIGRKIIENRGESKNSLEKVELLTE